MRASAERISLFFNYSHNDIAEAKEPPVLLFHLFIDDMKNK